MATPDISARLKFLDDAARLMLTPVPEVSRLLMSSHNSILLNNNELDNIMTRRETACNACGNLILLGQEGTLTWEKSKKPRRKHRGIESSKSIKALSYRCHACDRVTRLAASSVKKPARHRPRAADQSTGASTLSSTQPKPATTLPASDAVGVRKRSKSAKKGGMAAMLAKQKETQSSSSGFGLDLMDFMKRS